MITVCEGWRHPHTPIILSETDSDPGKLSHGMCPTCHEEALRELDALEAPVMPKYMLIWSSPTNLKGFYYAGNRHWSDRQDEALRFNSKNELHLEARLQLDLAATEYRIEEVTA